MTVDSARLSILCRCLVQGIAISVRNEYDITNGQNAGKDHAAGRVAPMYECTLEKEGFWGTFYESETPTDKAIILVGGSGEQRDFVERRAAALWKEGFHVLSLGYYLWKPLSSQTVWIPVDYAEKAVAFLKNKCPVTIRKIGMTGLSLGAAYSLLCASCLPDISCVVAVSGFDFVVEGCKNMLFRQHRSYFSYHGKDVPYEPAESLSHLGKTLRAWKRDPRYTSKAMLRFYYNECFPNRTDASRIKAENIRGDILLLAPAYDDTWPSDIAFPRIMQVLDEKRFPYRHECVIYEKGSHILATPAGSMAQNGKSEEEVLRVASKFITMEAKYPIDCRKARAESWERLVSFFREW